MKTEYSGLFQRSDPERSTSPLAIREDARTEKTSPNAARTSPMYPREEQQQIITAAANQQQQQQQQQQISSNNNKSAQIREVNIMMKTNSFKYFKRNGLIYGVSYKGYECERNGYVVAFDNYKTALKWLDTPEYDFRTRMFITKTEAKKWAGFPVDYISIVTEI